MAIRQTFVDESSKFEDEFYWYASPSFAIVDLEGRLLASTGESEACSLAATAQALLAICVEGDIAITNDPLVGSPHVTVFTMLVRGAEFSVLARARTPDTGGFEMGGFAPQSFDTWGEGVRFSPIRTRAGGQDVRHVRELLAINTRTPLVQRKTLDSMQKAIEGLLEAVDGEQLARFRAAKSEVHATAENLIGQWTPGPHRATGLVSTIGGVGRDIPLAVTASADSGRLHLDFSGSHGQQEGPYNSPLPVTKDACLAALANVSGLPHVVGLSEVCSVTAPSGLVVSAAPPASTAMARYATSVAVFDLVRVVVAAAADANLDADEAMSDWRAERMDEFRRLVMPSGARMRPDVIEQIEADERSLRATQQFTEGLANG